MNDKDFKKIAEYVDKAIRKNNEALIDTIMAGMERIHEENIVRFNNLDKRMDKLEKRMDSIEDNVRMNTTAIDDLGTIIATRPTIKDFNKLKSQVLKQ